MADMQGVVMKTVGTKLVLEIDMTQDFGPSSSGKTNVVASSGGFQKAGIDGISFSLNVCKKKAK